MKNASRFIIHTATLLLVAAFVTAKSAAPSKTIRVLTVGNSFSHNATHYLGDLAKAAGDTLILGEANVGGSSMELHWGKVLAYEKDPKDKAGLYTVGRGLKDFLRSQKWDFVTIQQASIKSHDLATYHPFAKQLRDYIKANSPDAELLLHETWEYRVDDPRFSPKTPKPGEPLTQDEMYQELSSAYTTIAKDLCLRRIPVGDAFHLANHDPKWGYQAAKKAFDPKTAKAGELPDQTHSLNMGWSWKKQADGTMKAVMDGHHANTAGEYLGACVWYEVLFGKSVEGNTFVPEKLDADYAKFLRSTAHRVVANEAASQNAK